MSAFHPITHCGHYIIVPLRTLYQRQIASEGAETEEIGSYSQFAAN